VADKDFPHASIVEGLRFTAQVAVPNVVQGLFRRRRTAAALATRTRADGLAYSFMSGLRRSYGDGPVWIRVAKDEALLAIGTDQVRHALEGAPEPFAADPDPKKSGMERFQPDALTISRNPEWEDRRRFTDAVLAGGMQELSERFERVSAEEAGKLSGELEWEGWNRAVRRVARRVILGDGAAGDEALSEQLGTLMDKANPPGGGDPELYERFAAEVRRYVEQAEPGSLAGLFASAPQSERTKPAGQVIHWLFALGDTLAINALRCLALLATHGSESELVLSELASADGSARRLDACLQEAMRLWPTTAMLARQTTREVEWDGVRVPSGTQVLIVNTFNHRDRSRHDWADRFLPDQWLAGDAAEDWSFNHFSHGPQGCPGVGLSLLVGRTMVSTVLRRADVRLLEPSLDASKPLPYSLDYFALKFSLAPR
jgi:cytochrome P450